VASDPIPANRRIDWTFSGVPGGIPNRTTICATFNPGATAAAINTAIAACSNGVIFLNAGTYTAAALGGQINMATSNVTLRGAGANQTILTGGTTILMGLSCCITTLNVAITGGASKNSTTFTVASATGLAIGTMIDIDREDDTNLIVNTGSQAGGTRNLVQVNMITGISGTTITVRNPLHYDFTTGTPKIRDYFPGGGYTQLSGVENIKMDFQTTSTATLFVQGCDRCWVKGVELANDNTYNTTICCGALNFEIRNSFIHDGGSGPNNSGIRLYGNYIYGGVSNFRVENNISNKVFPVVEINQSAGGGVVLYNYNYGTNQQGGIYLVTWAFDNDHGPFNIENLFEGNIGELIGADGFYGGSGLTTFARNYATGVNPNGTSIKGSPIVLKRLQYFYNMVGNVFGSTAMAPTSYQTGCGTGSIYEWGYPNIGNCDLANETPDAPFAPPGGYPDPKVTASLMRWGNYDYFNASTQFNNSEIPTTDPTFPVSIPPGHTIPNSYVYTSRPTWWPTSGPAAGIPWPPIGPDVTGGNGDTSGHVNKIPAQVCWESQNLLTGGTFNPATCYP
jgi:hypothetical protein